MPVERRRLERTLLKIGFVVSEHDHRVFILMVGGQRVLDTKTSRGSGYRTLGDDLVAEIARQMHISSSLLRQLVRAEKTADDYLAALRAQGLL